MARPVIRQFFCSFSAFVFLRTPYFCDIFAATQLQHIMKKQLFIFIILIVIVPVHTCASPVIVPDTLGFAVTKNYPDGYDGGGNSNYPHSPVQPPFVVREGHTLLLYSGCDGATLALIDEDDEEIYSVTILEGMSFITLPEWLEGIYELQIRRGQYVFYTEIEL